jgi:glutathione synthase
MSHIFFVDPIEKLNIKKDSSLMMGLSFMNLDMEVYLLFEKDFSVSNKGESKLKVYPYKGAFKDDGYYLEGIELGNPKEITISKADTIHMRIDPPYDSRYQRYLWMLDFMQSRTSCDVVNNPIGIMKHNEKLAAYKRDNSLKSFIGSSVEGFTNFTNELKNEGIEDLILKPLDLYSGIGVQKVSITDSKLVDIFKSKVEEFEGAIITQPFQNEVYDGEIRSVYLDGKEIGSIMKKPVGGDFLANIAQGALFEPYTLEGDIKKECDEVALELLKDGVNFIAYDILGGAITEINVTCPGLLVEVSYALKKNIANTYADHFNTSNM